PAVPGGPSARGRRGTMVGRCIAGGRPGYIADVESALIAIGLGAGFQVAIGAILWVGCALERRIEPSRRVVAAKAEGPRPGGRDRAASADDVAWRDAA